MASAYSSSQIEAWDKHVSLPTRFQSSQKPTKNIEYLNALHVHQIAAVPYENLILHYSKDHAVSLDPQKLYQKIVTDTRGRGGYCMENSILFNHVLRGLAFQVYTAGVRIRPRVGGVPSGDYIGWVHIVNIVTLPDGSQYMLDVGFGGDGATKPLPLISGHVEQNLGPQEIRLLYSTIPQQIDQSKKLWIYQYRNGQDREWNSFYAFPELEFLAQDFEIMNYYTSTSQGTTNFQTRTVLIVRFLRGKGEDAEKIVGKVMLVNGEVKRNMGGKTEVVKVCRTEEERLKALEEYFAIKLTEDEKKGVRGRNVELLLEG
ncbi:putative acetyltransferase [Hyphodiscus hymeniophilus]|uniref:Acetyltransferase n=1 Tax=Hyphodiscus hymeniophilus TaxID=353542 RepID=A0A9P6VGF5_9HELO|nr:putative acetyltransferase [Hyphodiscus hymeniophilus]